MLKQVEDEFFKLVEKYQKEFSIDNFSMAIDVKNYYKKINWDFFVLFERLSEEFMEEFIEYLDWTLISKHQVLSEFFIEKHKKRLDWDYICQYQILSEEFIRQHFDFINKKLVVFNQVLSCDFLEIIINDFITNNNNIGAWFVLFIKEELLDKLITKYYNSLSNWEYFWEMVSKNPNLSENFIRKYSDKLNWGFIQSHQYLSENFINEFIEKFDLDKIGEHQVLSTDFREKHNIIISDDNWLYKDGDWKINKIKENGLFEVIDEFVIAYKKIRIDNYSYDDFKRQYFLNKTYYNYSSALFKIRDKKINNKIIKIKIHKNDILSFKNYIIYFNKFDVIEEIL